MKATEKEYPYFIYLDQILFESVNVKAHLTVHCFTLVKVQSWKKVLGRYHYLEITPLPLINVGFSTKQNGDFSCNIEYEEGGGRGHKSKEHGISQMVQPIVRIMELGVK